MHGTISPTPPDRRAKRSLATALLGGLLAVSASGPAIAADADGGVSPPQPPVRAGGSAPQGPDSPAGPKATASEIGEQGRLPSRAPDRPSGTAWKTLDAVRDHLRGLGFRQVGDVDVDDDVYEVDARTADGDAVVLQVDPVTGQVLRVNAE